MKHLNTPVKLSVSLIALLLSQASLAAGTDPGGTDSGTIVENTATISYSLGGAAQLPITSDIANFTVDKKVDLTVTGNSATNIIVAPSSAGGLTGNKLTYVLSNDGNSSQMFKIDVTHDLATPSDDFDAGVGASNTPITPTACEFTIDDGTGAGALNALTASPTPTVTLTKGGLATIAVYCSMPNSPDVVDGDISTIDVLATAVVDANGVAMVGSTIADREDEVDIVLADGDSSDVVGNTSITDGAERNAKHSDTQTFEIDVPMLTVVKTSAVTWDPYNLFAQPKRIPGALVEYTITVSNTSDKEALNLTVTDVLQAEIDGEVKYVGPIVSPQSAVAGTYASNTVEATGITVPVAVSSTVPGVATVTFTVEIQ